MPDKPVEKKATTRLKALEASLAKLKDELEEHKRAFKSWLPFAGTATPLLDEEIRQLLPIDAIELHISKDLGPLVEDEPDNSSLSSRIKTLRRQIALEYGVPLPLIRIWEIHNLEPGHYQILLERVPVAKGEARYGQVLAMKPKDSPPSPSTITGDAFTEPVTGLPCIWISPRQQKRAERLGYNCYDATTVIITHLKEVAKRHLADFLDRQTVQLLLNSLETTHPEIIHDLVPGQMSIRQVQRVLRCLVKEGVSIRNLPRILETLAEHATTTKDPDALVEHVRAALGRQIGAAVANGKAITVVTLDQALEERLTAAVQASEQGVTLQLDPEAAAALGSQIMDAVEGARKSSDSPALLVNPKLRPALRRFIEDAYPWLAVLTRHEINSTFGIEAAGCIGLKVERGNPFGARPVPRLFLESPYRDEGRLVELWEADEEGTRTATGLFPSAAIVSDEAERLWLELYPISEPVRLPLEEVEGAIQQAKGEAP